jgi:hypothetical protein
MARNTLKLETSGFTQMLAKLEALGGDTREAVTEALENASHKITEDTIAAVDDANLPAGGKYSKGATRESIIQDAKITWEGSTAWIPVGFDFAAPGAGGFLITGTPKMRPDLALQRMYRQKKYMNQIQKEMGDVVMDKIVEAMT